MSRFVLVFDGEGVASAMGSAWVGVDYQLSGPRNLPVITHDCGSPREFERAIRDLQSELDDILRKGQAKFASFWKDKMAKRESDDAQRP
jgi:hypothetical protein